MGASSAAHHLTLAKAPERFVYRFRPEREGAVRDALIGAVEASQEFGARWWVLIGRKP